MVRIQLELPDEQVASLDQLMQETKLRTRKDLFNNALTLLDWAVKEKKAGRTVASIDDSQEVIKDEVSHLKPVGYCTGKTITLEKTQFFSASPCVLSVSA